MAALHVLPALTPDADLSVTAVQQGDCFSTGVDVVLVLVTGVHSQSQLFGRLTSFSLLVALQRL